MKDHVNALGALYQAEKTDATGIFNTAMALMGTGWAYISVIITNIDKFGVGLFNWSVVLLIPCPLWLIVAFQSLITLNAMSHGVSVRIIEEALFNVSGLPVEKRDLVGSASGDRIMDINKSRPVHQIITCIVYGGVAVFVVGLTVYVLNLTWNHVSNTFSVVAIVGYTFLLIIVALSWAVGLSMVKDADRRSSGKQDNGGQGA